MSETEIKLFQPVKLFQNYFSDIEHDAENIREMRQACEIIVK